MNSAIFLIKPYFRDFLSLLLGCFVVASCSLNTACTSHDDTLFTKMSPEETGIFFSNTLQDDEQINALTYHNFYNGGGVGVGDINNDGLLDIFFCGNQVANKLYLNKGNFQFQDISAKAGISTEGLWYTGVTLVDVNGDGWLDIYVCRAADFLVGWRGNELYINNGNLTFSEKAMQYGLSNTDFSTQSAFFDMDNDGDLDCYLLNNSKFGTEYYRKKNQRNEPDPKGGNKLYRNDNNHFVDVTTEAGIYQSIIGFGLGVTISDLNKDGWQDIYVSNDFFERDYFYVNNGTGSFTESLEKYMREISMFSMGADIADINNDSYLDIYVTDMLPEIESRVKSKTNFENWDRYQSNIDRGYHKQFLRNVLQLNRGPLTRETKPEYYFSEVGRLSGTCATDWSWGALIVDLDNDGYKDIFVSNGMYKDVTDQDFIQFMASDSFTIMKNNYKKILDLLPSTPLSKYAFQNKGNITFENKASEWGLDDPCFSNGSLYADLDNDGDMDLITSTINKPASVYRNNSVQLHPENKFLKLVLIGEGKNLNGFGAKATAYYNHTLSYLEQMPSRGFESTVDNRLNFGLGKTEIIDSIRIDWPGGKSQLLRNIKPNQTLVIKQADALLPKSGPSSTQSTQGIFTASSENFGLDFTHREDNFIDFNIDKLMFSALSRGGPHAAVADVNGDGLDDVFICGAKNQAGALFIQTKLGTFIRLAQPDIEQDKLCEDTDCLFFDADGDQDKDLFVCSGGNSFSKTDEQLRNRLYINDGRGNFYSAKNALPFSAPYENTSTVAASDFDNDGDTDLFVGGQIKPGQYGYPCRGYILENSSKGVFKDVTTTRAPELLTAGMITDSEWFDYNKDNKPDLVITGEFMPIRIFRNGGGFTEVTDSLGLNKSNGWWNKLTISDIDLDGYPDIIAGNQGLNTRYKASETRPVTMYVNDFDGNGTVEQILCTYNGEKQYPLPLRHDLVSPLPMLKKKFLKYQDYKEKTMQDIFTEEQMKKVLKLDAYQFQTAAFLNSRKNGFIIKPLPVEAQFSSTYAILASDFDGNMKPDILLAGNFHQAKPEVGIQDASYGLLLTGDGSGNFKTVPYAKSNLLISGAVRDMVALKINNKRYIAVAKNNETIEMLKY